jgi:hypothetical protein
MRRRLLPLLAAALAAAAVVAVAGADDDHEPERGPGYAIGLWGDVPYSAAQRESGVPNLIRDLNRNRLAFTVHDGDIKAGGERCDNPIYTQAEEYFNSLWAPAMYTPGDNEWTDCDRPSNGPYVSSERLGYIRSTMFDTPYSFGKRPIRLEVQAPPYVENRRWQFDKVTYGRVGGAKRRYERVAAADLRQSGRTRVGRGDADHPGQPRLRPVGPGPVTRARLPDAPS